MIYVISDIHGHFERYMNVINSLKETDFLYILGDVIDRGPDGIKIIKDIMNRPNVELLIGNHELMMMNTLEIYFKVGNEVSNYRDFLIWVQPCNGGFTTLEQIRKEPIEELQKIYEYLTNCYLIKRLEISKKKIHLSHSYTIENVKGDLKFKDASKDERFEVVWRSVFRRGSSPISYKFNNKEEIYIFGHTPVEKVTMSNEIYECNKDGIRMFDIDCGMAMNESFSRIGCLRLEDFKRMYF